MANLVRTPDDDPVLGSARADADSIRASLTAALADAAGAYRRRSALIVTLRDAGYSYAEIEAAVGVRSIDIAKAVTAAHPASGIRLADRILDVAADPAEARLLLSAVDAPDKVTAAAEAELDRRLSEPAAP